MVKKALTVLALLFSSVVYSQGIEGIYQLEIQDSSGAAISRGTGFLVQSKYSDRPYIVTSFHLINARLLEADRIKINTKDGGRYLNIVAYDELNDLLALSSEGLSDQALNISYSCSEDLNVAGYHEGKLMALDIKGSNIVQKGISRLPVYLTKGFSGAPVMNEVAGVCGMVVLSSEQNASSVAVSHAMIDGFLNAIEPNQRTYGVRALRVLMGVERIARTQADLDNILSNTSSQRQLVINIMPESNNETFLIRNASNVVVEAASTLKRLTIHQSRNIMVRGINAGRLIVNESDGVTITECTFDQNSQALFLKDSKDMLISKNNFRKINTGIVLKAATIDQASLINNNSFELVDNKIQML